MAEVGIMNRLKEKYISPLREERIKAPQLTEVEFDMVYTILMLFIGGVVSSLVILTLEILFYKISKLKGQTRATPKEPSISETITILNE